MILIHYGEIGLKGKNRITFENRLQRNVQRALGGRVEWVRREYGRIIAQEGEDV
ncbi:MAG: tRNA 4-thiouridine(8) synthase ThiI, partial [Thermoplasmata archaeon]